MDWEWAYANVVEDHREQGKLLSSFMDSLTWWLQPDIKREMENKKKNAWPAAANWEQELRDNGASEEYIQKEMAALQKEREEENYAEDDDRLEVIG